MQRLFPNQDMLGNIQGDRISLIRLSGVCVCVCACVHVHIQLCLTLCNPTDCSLLGSSVHGIFQARMQELAAIAYSRGSSDPRIKPASIAFPALTGRLFTIAPPGKPLSDIYA